MTGKKNSGLDLREASIQTALEIIETSGLESLSLREVARRLGVSHQAPYKHFPSRDHILAEIVRRVFENFVTHLESLPVAENPSEDLQHIGQVYLSYALAHPLHYRLMFNTPLPDPQQHPAMMQSARRAFDLLAGKVEQLATTGSNHHLTLDVLFIWATMHGLASILQTRALDALALSQETLAQAAPYILTRLQAALNAPQEIE